MRIEMIGIGEKLRRRRELLRLHQQDLSTMAGVSTRTIQQIEQGKGNPSLDTLFRLADSLGLQLDLLLKNSSNQSNT